MAMVSVMVRRTRALRRVFTQHRLVAKLVRVAHKTFIIAILGPLTRNVSLRRIIGTNRFSRDFQGPTDRTFHTYDETTSEQFPFPLKKVSKSQSVK